MLQGSGSGAGVGKDGGRVLAKGGGESAQGAASAGCAGLAFQPGHGSEADACVAGQPLLRQAAQAAQAPEARPVKNGCPRRNRAAAICDGQRRCGLVGGEGGWVARWGWAWPSSRYSRALDCSAHVARRGRQLEPGDSASLVSNLRPNAAGHGEQSDGDGPAMVVRGEPLCWMEFVTISLTSRTTVSVSAWRSPTARAVKERAVRTCSDWPGTSMLPSRIALSFMPPCWAAAVRSKPLLAEWSRGADLAEVSATATSRIQALASTGSAATAPRCPAAASAQPGAAGELEFWLLTAGLCGNGGVNGSPQSAGR
jgi:hypothetical protein